MHACMFCTVEKFHWRKLLPSPATVALLNFLPMGGEGYHSKHYNRIKKKFCPREQVMKGQMIGYTVYHITCNHYHLTHLDRFLVGDDATAESKRTHYACSSRQDSGHEQSCYETVFPSQISCCRLLDTPQLQHEIDSCTFLKSH